MEKYARHVPLYLFYLLIFNLTENIVEKCHRCGVWPVWTVSNDKQGFKIFHILQVAQTPTHCPAQVEICSPNVTCSKPSMSGFAGLSPVLMRTAVWRQRRRRGGGGGAGEIFLFFPVIRLAVAFMRQVPSWPRSPCLVSFP